MTDLPVFRLHEIAEVRLGRQRSPKDHDGPMMRPYVRAANVGWGGLLLDDVKLMNFTDAELAVYGLKTGDLLLNEASGSASEVGKPAIWNEEIEPCAFQNTLLRVRPRSVHSRYLLHYFKQQASSGAFARKSRGVGIHHLGREALAEWPVPLPPLEEQWRIAVVLDQADDLRAKRRASLAMIDSLNESIFLDMFGDPVGNPRGWPQFSFGEICPTRLGKMLDQKQQTGRNRRRYLRNANVRWFDFDLGDVEEMDFDAADRSGFRVEPGDLMICEGGEPGRAAVWDGRLGEIYFQKALHRGRPDPSKATAIYLVHLLRHLALRGGLVDHISSATIAHLTGARLKTMKVPVPSLALQEDFGGRIGGVERSRTSCLLSGREFERLFASLRYRAFAGQL